MSFSIIDVASDPTPRLAQLKASGIKTIISYMSSIEPEGEKCWTVERVKAAAAAGFRIGLVHEGFGGIDGHGISAADGERDGKFCREKSEELGAPSGACQYFACDNDFTVAQIKSLVVPYFQEIQDANADGFYRVGVYGSGLVCQAMINAQLVDCTWLAQSHGWMGYTGWLAKATMIQGEEITLDGLDVDTNIAQGDIGDYVPVWPAAVV